MWYNICMEWKNNYSKEKYYQVLTKGLLKEESHKRFAEREFFKEKKADLTLSMGHAFCVELSSVKLC